ncbi:conjugal transfer protein TrbA [uncultured Ruminococcus sp.]|nr:conjugal transfer protein TrbA [uncultured Clostridium sp.]SCH61884.1 conjugal transfer protein TrbA [uncultured Ruminococcus sp.]
MKYDEILVHRIQELCEERDYSINYLATISGVSHSTLDSIMHGSSQNPKLKTIHRIALAFNMTLSEFLDFEELNEYAFEDQDESSD